MENVTGRSSRIGLFVDFQSLQMCASAQGIKPDFKKILELASLGGALRHRIVYDIYKDEPGSFYAFLEHNGFKVKRKKGFEGDKNGCSKKDWKVAMTVDIVRALPYLDAVVLVSGRDDFIEIAKYVREEVGIRFDVLFFNDCSPKLIESATMFIDMNAEGAFFKNGERK